MCRKVALFLSIAALLLTGIVGVRNGVTEWGEGGTAWQHSVTVAVFLYGVFGLVSAYGLVRRRRWSVATILAWCVTVTYAPGVAVMAYSDKDTTLGSAIAASAASALIALGILLTANVMTRKG
jgi:hypothetical protein